MQMKMFVGVDVVQGEPACRKSFELGADLSDQLPPNPGQTEKPHAVARNPFAKTTLRVDQIRNSGVWQDRLAVGQHQVQSDAQTR